MNERECIGVHGKDCTEPCVGTLCFCAECNRTYLDACKAALAASRNTHRDISNVRHAGIHDI